MDPQIRGKTPTNQTTATSTTATKTTTETKTTPKAEQEKDPDKKPPGRKLSIFVGIVFLILILAAGGVMFWIILTQEKIDESPKKVFEQHKTATIESVRNSVKVVQTFPNLVKDFSLEDMSPKLFELIRKELNIVDLKTKILERLPNSIFDNLAHTIEILKQCSLPRLPITEKTEFMAMLNDPIEAQNKEMENIEKPVDKSQDNFRQLSDKESAKTGRLSKQNLVGYSASMTTMLNNYQARTVTRTDSFIKSYENQVSSRNIAELAQFLLTIILYSIAMMIFGADTAFFIVFQARKITMATLKKYSNIYMLICLIFAVGLSVYAVLGTFEISPFRYDCELIGDSQSSDEKFLNFDGQVATLRSITDECKKDESVYSKMSPYLNKKTISGYLDNYQSDVQHFSTGFTSLDISMNSHAIGSHISNVVDQFNKFQNPQIKNCKNMNDAALNNIQFIKSLWNNRSTDLKEFNRLGIDIPVKLANLPLNTNQFIQTSFKELKNITLKTVDTINNQLDSSDIPCHLNIPTGLCENRDNYFSNTNIVWYIMAGVYFLIGLLSKLLYTIPARKVSHEQDMTEEMRKMADNHREETRAAKVANEHMYNDVVAAEGEVKKLKEDLEIQQKKTKKAEEDAKNAKKTAAAVEKEKKDKSAKARMYKRKYKKAKKKNGTASSVSTAISVSTASAASRNMSNVESVEEPQPNSQQENLAVDTPLVKY